MHTVETIWKKTLTEIELEISKPNYNTWFKKTQALKLEDGTFYIAVPNEFNKEWLHTKFNKMIFNILRKHESTIKNVEYEVHKKTQQTESTFSPKTKTE